MMGSVWLDRGRSEGRSGKEGEMSEKVRVNEVRLNVLGSAHKTTGGEDEEG